MTILKVIFWICFSLVFYTYLGYGVLLWLLVKIKHALYGKRDIASLPDDDALPDITFLICAYNEQDIVEQKMQNTLQLNYPKERLHIMKSDRSHVVL